MGGVLFITFFKKTQDSRMYKAPNVPVDLLQFIRCRYNLLCVYIYTRACSDVFIDTRPRSVPTIDIAHIALYYSIFQCTLRPTNKLSCFARTSCCHTVSVDQVPLVSVTIPRASSQSVISALITTLRKPSLHPFSVFSQERS